MLAYWLMFGFFTAGALFKREQGGANTPTSWMLITGMLLLVLFIGLRYEVGGDWDPYQLLFDYARYHDLGQLFKIGDPGYQLINWGANQVGADIWLVNLIAAAVFGWGLYRFARVQPDPWLTVVVAIPFLVIVIAMGFTRQSMAIGLILAGLASLQRRSSVMRFAAYVAVAALFHKTVVIVLPLVIFAGRRDTLLTIVAAIATAIFLYDLFLAQSLEKFVRNYIQTGYSAQGAAIRVAMNVVPALLFVWFRRRLQFDEQSDRIWFLFSLAALSLPIFLLLVPSSSAVDRVAYYLIPLQLAVLSRAPVLFTQSNLGRVMVATYSFAVMFVWLNFATHAKYWLPYQSYLLNWAV